MVASIPELGVVSTHQNDLLASSGSHKLTSRPPSEADDGGVHVYVHAEEGLSKRGKESEDEVMLQSSY